MVRVQLPAAAPVSKSEFRNPRPERNPKAESRKACVSAIPFGISDFFGFRPSDFTRGRGRQAMHLLCKQVDVGALPTDSTSLRSLSFRGGRLPRRSMCVGGHLVCLRGFGSASQFQLRETRPMHREKPHKLLQVGVTPTPATNFPGM